eukprot:361880-Chlamydomonas_euryale.AAC.2
MSIADAKNGPTRGAAGRGATHPRSTQRPQLQASCVACASHNDLCNTPRAVQVAAFGDVPRAVRRAVGVGRLAALPHHGRALVQQRSYRHRALPACTTLHADHLAPVELVDHVHALLRKAGRLGARVTQRRAGQDHRQRRGVVARAQHRLLGNLPVPDESLGRRRRLQARHDERRHRTRGCTRRARPFDRGRQLGCDVGHAALLAPAAANQPCRVQRRRRAPCHHESGTGQAEWPRQSPEGSKRAMAHGRWRGRRRHGALVQHLDDSLRRARRNVCCCTARAGMCGGALCVQECVGVHCAYRNVWGCTAPAGTCRGAPHTQECVLLHRSPPHPCPPPSPACSTARTTPHPPHP